MNKKPNCRNFNEERGCVRPLGRGLCPKVILNRIWSDDEGRSSFVIGKSRCALTGQELRVGRNFTERDTENYYRH